MIDRSGATNGAQLAIRWLDITGVIHSTRLQNDRLAIPVPRQAEAGQCLGLNRGFQLGALPVDAAIGRDVDLFDLAAARPGQAGDRVVALFKQLLAARRGTDNRFAFLNRGVLAVLAVRHQVDVVNRFVLRAIRLVTDFDTTQPLDPRNALYAGHN